MYQRLINIKPLFSKNPYSTLLKNPYSTPIKLTPAHVKYPYVFPEFFTRPLFNANIDTPVVFAVYYWLEFSTLGVFYKP